jgi:hypothetical protein
VITTETTSLANKETSEYPCVTFQSSADPTIVENLCTTNFSNEKPQLSSKSNACSEMPEKVITEIESTVDFNPSESAVIIIQASNRGYLVQRALIKRKKVVKLQVVVRGYSVRRHVILPKYQIPDTILPTRFLAARSRSFTGSQKTAPICTCLVII